ncbi:MAG: hypothetical protein IT434_16690 [Phycisphaerales bacterium]|jgi:hypothetical protein|nr:hypothetical protein [Phycisphaerales bacterium]
MRPTLVTFRALFDAGAVLRATVMVLGALALAFVMFAKAPTALAVPQNGGNHSKPLDATEVLARISGAYRDGAVADRVSLVATPYPVIEGPLPARAIRRAVAIVRTARSTTQFPMAKLELGELRICAQPGSTTAIRQGDREHAARFAIDGDPTPSKLAQHLPMLAFPQLWLALGHETSEPLTSLTGVVTWESAESVAAGSRRLLVVRGKSATHDVVLSALAGTGRLDSFEITPFGVAGAKIVGRCAAIAPGDPASWGIEVGSRAIVKTLGELRATPGVIEPGATILDPPLQTMDLRAWSLLGELKSRSGQRPAAAAMILFTRDASAPMIDAALAGVLRAEVALDLESAAPTPLEAGAGLTTPPSLLSLGVACLARDGFDAAALTKIGEAWREGTRSVLARVLPQATPEPVLLTWTGASDELLGRLAPGAACAVVLVGEDLRLLGVIELYGKPGEEAMIADQISAIAGELRWPNSAE